MAVKTLIESEILFHGWGPKGRSVELLPAETRKCLRKNSGRSHDPSDPSICGYGSQPKQRLLKHPTIRIPEGTPFECPDCGGLALHAHPEADLAVARAAVEDGRVVRLDVSRGVYTLGDLVEFLSKLFPALGLGAIHVELVGPDQASVPFEEPAEAEAPKSETDELKERLARLEVLLIEQAEKPRRRKSEPEPA